MQEQRPYPSIFQSVGIVFIILSFIIIGSVATSFEVEDEATKNLVSLLAKIFAMGGAFFVIHRIRSFSGAGKYNFRPASIWILLAAIVAWVLLYALMLIIPYNYPEIEQTGYLAKDKTTTSVYIILRTALVAPFFEELIFRGIMLDGLMRRYGATTALLVSSALFGVMHLDLVQSVAAMFMGILLGWFYLQTRSLFVCIFIHALNNFMTIYPFPGKEDEELISNAFTPVEFYTFYTISAILFAGCILFIVRHARKHRQQETVVSDNLGE